MECFIKYYYNHIIKPIEKRCIELEDKIYSKKISDFILRSIHEKYLKLYRQLLLEKYSNLGKIISEEYEFLEEFGMGKQKQ